MRDESRAKVVGDIKRQIQTLKKLDLEPNGPLDDPLLAAWLLQVKGQGATSVEALARGFGMQVPGRFRQPSTLHCLFCFAFFILVCILGWRIPCTELTGTSCMWRGQAPREDREAKRSAVSRLHTHKQLVGFGMDEYYRSIEMPTALALARMEEEGVGVCETTLRQARLCADSSSHRVVLTSRAFFSGGSADPRSAECNRIRGQEPRGENCRSRQLGS
eukprot:3800745-Rhodomonas_salina.1